MERDLSEYDLLVTDKPCETCTEGARETFGEPTREDLSWWCWMHWCEECQREDHLCGETRP